jgi:hypothetical protein
MRGLENFSGVGPVGTAPLTLPHVVVYLLTSKIPAFLSFTHVLEKKDIKQKIVFIDYRLQE